MAWPRQSIEPRAWRALGRDRRGGGGLPGDQPGAPDRLPSRQPMVHSGTRHATRTSAAATIIRQRRSAVAFDGRINFQRHTFFSNPSSADASTEKQQLERPMPWDLLPWDPAIHLLLFVHRVGSDAGVSTCWRAIRKTAVSAAGDESLNWVDPVPGGPSDLPCIGCCKATRSVWPHRSVVTKALPVTARFHSACWPNSKGACGRADHGGIHAFLGSRVGQTGPTWRLKQQVCGDGHRLFFDDPVHEIVGIKDLALQSLYHFTIGGPVDDGRLLTLAGLLPSSAWMTHRKTQVNKETNDGRRGTNSLCSRSKRRSRSREAADSVQRDRGLLRIRCAGNVTACAMTLRKIYRRMRRSCRKVTMCRWTR